MIRREVHDADRRTDRRTKPTGIVIRAWMVSLSFGAAAIHASVIGGHFREYWLFGVFFATVAALQVLWGVLVLVRPSPRLYELGAFGASLLVLVWVASRTVGVPIGPGAGSPEQLGVLDMVSTGFEILIVTAALLLTRTRLGALALSPSAVVLASAGAALTVLLGTIASLVVAISPGPGALARTARFTPHLIHFVLLFGALIFMGIYAFATRPKEKSSS
jgi:hypothetical protein